MTCVGSGGIGQLGGHNDQKGLTSDIITMMMIDKTIATPQDSFQGAGSGYVWIM